MSYSGLSPTPFGDDDNSESEIRVEEKTSPVLNIGFYKKAQCHKSRRKLCHKKSLGLMDLPEEIQIYILQKLPYPQLLTMKKVSKHFAGLIEQESSTLIKGASLHNMFPKPSNLKILSWLSSQGNLEATIKLSLGHLYNDGLSNGGSNYREQNSIKAAKYFCELEQNSQVTSPVTWIFIRPPWSTAAVCCKAYVFDYLVKMVNEGNNHPHLMYCIGKVLNLFENDEAKRRSAQQWLQRAADRGLPDAMYDLWCMELKELDKKESLETLISTRSPGHLLCLVRRLREIAGTGYKPAQMQLCRIYAQGNYGGMCLNVVSKYVRTMFSVSRGMRMNRLFQVQSYLTVNMRYILVDWLLEVATMKDFSQDLVHATVKCIDRYLLMREVPRSWLQLLGIACMVICTRFMENDLLTIREAVWLTDNTYKYEELVRMMEEIVSALDGNVKNLTTYDYLSIFFNLNVMDAKCQTYAKFISEASLLHSDTGNFPPALVAAACALIANLSTQAEIPWCTKMFQFTSFTEEQIAPVALHIHKLCLMEEPPTDLRDVKLDAIEERYLRTRFGAVKREKMISRKDLLGHFGLTEEEVENMELKDIPKLTCRLPQPPSFSSSIHLSSSSIVSYSSEIQSESLDVEQPSSSQCAAAGFQQEESSDEEMDTDTPPTLSCAYLMRTDVSTRKRIRTQRSPTPPSLLEPSTSQKTSYLPSASKPSEKKIHPRKSNPLQPSTNNVSQRHSLNVHSEKNENLQAVRQSFQDSLTKENQEFKSEPAQSHTRSKKCAKIASERSRNMLKPVTKKHSTKSPLRM